MQTRVVNFPHSRAVREMTCGKFSRGKFDAGNAGNFEGENTLKSAIFPPKMECETKSENNLNSSSSYITSTVTKFQIKSLNKMSPALDI